MVTGIEDGADGILERLVVARTLHDLLLGQTRETIDVVLEANQVDLHVEGKRLARWVAFSVPNLQDLISVVLSGIDVGQKCLDLFRSLLWDRQSGTRVVLEQSQQLQVTD